MSPTQVLGELDHLDASAAGSAAGVLTGTAVTANLVAASSAAARTSMPRWRGAALANATEAAARINGHLDLLTHTARAGAELLQDHARQLVDRKARMRLLVRGAEEAERRMQRAEALATYAVDAAEVDRLLRARRLLVKEHDEASRELARRLDALVHDVAGRPRSWGEHLTGGAGTFLTEGVVQPAAAIGVLAFGWVHDPAGWWRTVRGVPGAYAEDVRNPRRAAAEALRVEDFRAGRTGEGIGALAAVVAARGVAKAVPAPPRRLPHRPQSLEEMLAGVDLDRHEGLGGAHALSRHVHVDDAYLRDRLVLGTLMPDGTRKLPAPPVASRWVDVRTAEHHMTRILRDSEDHIRRQIGAGQTNIEVSGPVPPAAGVVMTRTRDGFAETPATSALIRLRRVDGVWTIHTAYLQGAT